MTLKEAGMKRWLFEAVAVVVMGALVAPAVIASGPAAPPADEDARIVHALNRLGYGPRPGDVDAVRAMGLERWIERQLHPERIDDGALRSRLAGYRTLGLSVEKLMEGYEVPREVKREIQKKRAEMDGASEEDTARARRELMKELGSGMQQMQGRPRQVVEELQAAKVMRAVYSQRQLDEVLVDFWMNHFNVFAGKGPEKFLVGAYERDVIRPRAWGKFEDLLKATAESPAMLFYLDNWLSASADAQPPARGRRGGFLRRGRPAPPEQEQGQGRKRGLNENYAREVMELHTLGVDGGYTQKDVTEVARSFTGWTIRGLRQGDPRFVFDGRIHDGKDKLVLGQRIKGGGKSEGDQILHMLATHPATARFISTKLARRFVADDPPAALVDRAAATFRKTGGDIRSVVATILQSPEFLSAEARSAKVKTPLEFVASAARAAGADVKDARELARRIGEMGMPLYMQQPPTGYKDTSDAWVSTSGLLSRLNLALDLAAGRVKGVDVRAASLAPDVLLPAGLSEPTRRTLERETGLDAARMAGLVLGSPEFQRR
jgi:uncharacterized protein (DUF1800 family)